MGLNAGNMDREIVIQRAQPVQSTSGEETMDWANATSETVWAAWLPADTKEAWKASQRLESYVDGVFVTYDLDPRPSPSRTRILFDGKVFDVRPVVEIGRGEGLSIPVTAHGE